MSAKPEREKNDEVDHFFLTPPPDDYAPMSNGPLLPSFLPSLFFSRRWRSPFPHISVRHKNNTADERKRRDAAAGRHDDKSGRAPRR